MTELLTESFCERCGTRYTFESSAPRRSRFSRVRTLSKGVRNFVMSDDSSFSEAMAEARSEEEIAATAHQLDAFHQTFNFCLTCRQYTCGDCWNNAEGRCLTCAPMTEVAQPAPLFVVGVEPQAVFGAHANGNGHAAAPGIGAWPTMDVADWPAATTPEPMAAGPADIAPPTAAPDLAEPGVAADAATEFAGAAEPAATFDIAEVLAAEADVPTTAAATTGAAPEPQPGPAVFEPERGPEPIVTRPVQGVPVGQTLDEAIAAYEAMLAAEEAEAAMAEPEPVVMAEPEPVVMAEPEPVVMAEPEPVVMAEPEPVVMAEPEPVVMAEPEPVAAIVAEPEPAIMAEPEPVAAIVAEPEPEPVAAIVAEPEPEPVSAAPAVDRIEQPTWPVPAQPVTPVQPQAPVQAPAPRPAPEPSPWLTHAPDDAAVPHWPAAPQWPAASAQGAAPTTFGGRPILPQADASALWAASAREVLGAAPVALAAAAPTPTAQPCVNCGLSLSSTARFCRRCGSRQA